jgi:hypothetical protein
LLYFLRNQKHALLKLEKFTHFLIFFPEVNFFNERLKVSDVFCLIVVETRLLILKYALIIWFPLTLFIKHNRYPSYTILKDINRHLWIIKLAGLILNVFDRRFQCFDIWDRARVSIGVVKDRGRRGGWGRAFTLGGVYDYVDGVAIGLVPNVNIVIAFFNRNWRILTSLIDLFLVASNFIIESTDHSFERTYLRFNVTHISILFIN